MAMTESPNMIPVSWLKIDPESPFSLANIPFGIISTSSNPTPRPAIAIGEYAVDLEAFALGGGFAELPKLASNLQVFSQTTLNAFAALGQTTHRDVRRYLQEIFTEEGRFAKILQQNKALQDRALISSKNFKTHLPMRIGDYTDFYAGRHHAYNVGVMFRGKENAMQPNYEYIPVGYHGRASSVVISGTSIRRPQGQILLPGAKEPIFSPCRKLDIELELGAFVCRENEMGSSIPIADAKDYIFGLVLLNDWSARDIQAWEYVPLGPFLSKSFGTTISPWVVLTDALEPFLDFGLAPGNRDSLLPYLKEKSEKNVYNIELTADLKTKAGNTTRITKTSSKNLLYSFPQMLAHHAVGGCPMKVGDLLGSGTISGPEPGTLGSLLEQTNNGKELIEVSGGERRTFLEDGDQITIRGTCGAKPHYVGFGECVGRIW
ncbi:MAG: hypothetical protein M1818_007753 [Claussenomyces sp. TS43310]|nr:MAG: hypothetical protein M1818_007753 [Claussenomyces sp. TS43310]